MKFEVPPEARTVVEREIWAAGVTGDSCAHLAERIFRALGNRGFIVAESPDSDEERPHEA